MSLTNVLQCLHQYLGLGGGDVSVPESRSKVGTYCRFPVFRHIYNLGPGALNLCGKGVKSTFDLQLVGLEICITFDYVILITIVHKMMSEHKYQNYLPDKIFSISIQLEIASIPKWLRQLFLVL